MRRKSAGWWTPDSAPRNAMRGCMSNPGICCARAASGHAAAPPSRVMNSRRPRKAIIWSLQPEGLQGNDSTVAPARLKNGNRQAPPFRAVAVQAARASPRSVAFRTRSYSGDGRCTGWQFRRPIRPAPRTRRAANVHELW